MTSLVLFNSLFQIDILGLEDHSMNVPLIPLQEANLGPSQHGSHQRIAVKRRFSDPQSFDFHAKLHADTSVPFFYHIYIPESSKEQAEAMRIVQEQLNALAASNATTNQIVTVFYQTIGPGNGSDEQILITELCQERNIRCHLMGHFADGREELTTHRVYEFCRADSSRNENLPKSAPRRVVYMHNKGSHHYSELNERWRRKMMQAVTHKQCLDPPELTCNFCSLFLTAERGIFSAGNFWVASCPYIQKLVPPLEYEGHMERVVKDALYMNLEQKITMNLHKHWPPSFGIGRYAAENWAGSHPDIVPCDFSDSFVPQPTAADNTLDFLSWVNQTRTTADPAWSLRWSLAPKHPIKLPDRQVRTNERMRLTEYFLLAGHILRWYELYDNVPGNDSWVWAYYPDGRKWRNAIEQYGRNALKELTEGAHAGLEHE